MKEKTDILTLQETEQLCRLYLDCRLSVKDEAELRYLLGRLPYSSPLIREVRESMIAEGLPLSAPRRQRKRSFFRWIGWAEGIAAAVAIALTLTVFIGNHNAPGSEEVMVAYVGGKKLDPEESRKVVTESMARARSLMAMAQAKEREARATQQYYMSLVSEN